MSYIRSYDDNYYTPSKNLHGLFQNLVVQPVMEGLPPHAQRIQPVNIRQLTIQRQIIGRGRTNFDEPYQDFTPVDKVLFYCYHYMPMHLYSSYHIFRNVSLPASNKVVFIDFGCGPLTSGIAFWANARTRDITYIGIDSSITMLRKAREINRYGPYGSDGSSEPFYKDTQLYLIRDYNELPQLLTHIKADNSADPLVVFNFCYFFQSKTFEDSSKIEELGELLYFSDLGTKICMMYQDPVGDGFQERWHNFKSWVITYPSMYDVSGFGWQDPTKVVSVKYDTLWGEQRAIKVSHDSFNNFYYHDHYRHR